MSRRKPTADAGTDSFLDVLANLVGILVILVVVTALRAAAPVAVPPGPPATAAPAPRRPLLAPKPNVVYEYAPPPPAPADLIAAADAARAAADAAARRSDAARDRAVAAAAELDRLRAEAAALRAEFAAANSRRRAAETAATSAAADLAAARAGRERWALALRRTDAAPPPTEPLEHRLLPVGRVVTGRELHFRLLPGAAGGPTVRPVPIDALTDRLEADARGHRDRLLFRGRLDGTVGPVGGYEMRYRMKTVGVGDQTKAMLNGWTLHSVNGAAAESVAAALRDGSEFRFALATAGPDATATFWVAPETFAAFRTLREAARAAGLTVAARPLPADVPISGSPRGTRSVAQ